MQSPIPKKLARIDWFALRVVLEVARTGSIKRAAARLQMAESTVSRHVMAVEHGLEVDLFERTAAGMSATRAGEQLLRHLLRAESEVEGGLEAVRDVEASASGIVRMTTVPTLANYLVARSSNALLSAYPNLELEVIGVPADLSMKRREADLAIRLSRPTSDFDALTRRLGYLEYGVFAKKGASDEDGRNLPWMTYDNTMASLPQAKWVEERVRKFDEQTYRLRCNDAEGLIAVARAGMAKALIPKLVAAMLPDLEEQAGFSDLPKREVWLLSHPNVAPTTRVRVVVEWLASLFINPD